MIWVTPLSGLEETIRRTGARQLIRLLSAGADFAPPPGLAPARTLQLAMHDIAEERPGFVAPSADHVRLMIAFAKGWTRDTPLVVHCYAGISRSTAAAYVLAAALRSDLDEAGLAAELRRLSPAATPNPLIVAHGDRLLGREGRMIAAIRAIGRGAEAREGNPFCLPV